MFIYYMPNPIGNSTAESKLERLSIGQELDKINKRYEGPNDDFMRNLMVELGAEYKCPSQESPKKNAWVHCKLDEVMEEVGFMMPTNIDPNENSKKMLVEHECPSCSGELQDIAGNLSCRLCGLELGNDISMGRDWQRGEDGGMENVRCNTIIDPDFVESSYGVQIAMGKIGQYDPIFNSIRKNMSYLDRPYSEKNRSENFNVIKTNCRNNHLDNDIADLACDYYDLFTKHKLNRRNGSINTTMVKKKMARGDNNQGIMGACVYFACQNHHNPRTNREIAKMFSIDEIYVTRARKTLYPVLQVNGVLQDMNMITYKDFMTRFCNKLGLNEELRKFLECVAQRSEKNKILRDNIAKSKIAGYIYFVCTVKGLNISRDAIAKCCDTSSQTINKTYRKLVEHMDTLLD